MGGQGRPLYHTQYGRLRNFSGQLLRSPRLPQNQGKPGGAGVPPVPGHRLKTCATELQELFLTAEMQGGHCPPFDWMRSQAELGGKAGSWRKTGNQSRIDAQGGMRFAFPPYGPMALLVPGPQASCLWAPPFPTKKLFKTAPHGPAAHPQRMKRPAFLTLDPGLCTLDFS
jgi:hypothetical protein